MEFRDLEILDTTLRDGSYIIDFQFTAEDTALIASMLEAAGIRLIEIAHGLGLGAARAGQGDQASSDEAYLSAAASVLKDAAFGTFFIPGIGVEDDLRLAAGLGARFIRIGTNVTDLHEAEPFAVLAKELGLTVFCNLMKSYAVAPAEFADCGRRAEDFGADVLCLVDSAGGMLPEDVREYLEAAREACGLRLAFHGHNNLSMAIANTLAAHESGATILDATLQGMGRQEGNAMTEILVAILQNRGLLEDIDVNALLDASEAFIRPLMHHPGYSGFGITSGRAKFHSSFLGEVIGVAKEFGVDARDLILRLCEHDQINAPRDLVEKLAQELAQEGPKGPVHFAMGDPAPSQAGDIPAQVRERAFELKEKARKADLHAVFNMVVTDYEDTHVSPFVETKFGCALSNVMLCDGADLNPLLAEVDGIVDYVLADPGDAELDGKGLQKSALLTYSDKEMWARATVSHVTQLLGGDARGKTVALAGKAPLVTRAAALFEEAGCGVLAPGTLDEAAARLDALVALSPRVPCVDAGVVESMREGALLYDGGIGSLSPEAVETAEGRGIRVVRIDLRPTLAATALELISMKRLVEHQMGRAVWDGVSVVAGGLIGGRGDVIVDSIQNAVRVIGVADGRGGILDADPADENIRRVRKVIAGRQLHPE